jgi:hypothetical protein
MWQKNLTELVLYNLHIDPYQNKHHLDYAESSKKRFVEQPAKQGV